MDKTFVAGAVCALIAVLSAVTGITYASVNKTKAMVEMVSKGANPMSVHCAVDGINTSNQQVCVTLASQGIK